MSAYPPAYSNPNQYGSAFSSGPAPPPPSAYGQPVQTQPTVNIQIDPNTAALMQQQMAYAMAFLDPNNPANNENPVKMKCPCCHREITTETEYVVGGCTILACVLCGAMGFIPCCWIPFVMNWSKDVIHRCPSCKGECGKFERAKQKNRVDAYGRRR